MAKRIVVDCDNAEKHGDTPVPGHTVKTPFLDENGEPRSLDVCDGCYDEVIRPAADFVARYGQPMTPGQWHGCSECGRGFTTKQGLKLHLTRTHGLRREKEGNPP